MVWRRVSADTFVRMASVNTFINSSASGPKRCAPNMRSVFSSISTLKPEQSSATLLDEYQLAVSSWWTRKSQSLLLCGVFIHAYSCQRRYGECDCWNRHVLNLPVISLQ